MKAAVLSASLMIFAFLGTASSDPQPVVTNSVASIDFTAPAPEPSCTVQSPVQSAGPEQVPLPIFLASGYCYNDCSTCYPVGSLCSNGRGQCTSIPLC